MFYHIVFYFNFPAGTTLPFPFFVHCHFFVKAPDDMEDNWYFSEAQNLLRESLGYVLMAMENIPSKFKLSFAYWNKYLFSHLFEMWTKFIKRNFFTMSHNWGPNLILSYKKELGYHISYLVFRISKLDFIEVRFVRSVAGRKKMFCATFQFPDELLFSSDMQKLKVGEANSKELAKIKECSSGSNIDERTSAQLTCSQRTACEMQIEEPQIKKNKFCWKISSVVFLRHIVNV